MNLQNTMEFLLSVPEPETNRGVQRTSGKFRLWNLRYCSPAGFSSQSYLSQSFRIKDQKIKDLFLDIAAEELGHMEMVAQTINLLNGHDVDADQVKAGEIQSHVILG